MISIMTLIFFSLRSLPWVGLIVGFSWAFYNLIRKKIGFKNILISDDLSMKSLKDDLKTNTIKTFSAGCNCSSL